MKKLLSLLLAMVMTLSLVTIGAGAEELTFTDSNSITYEEAVGVLSGLGIINGRTDGSFAPTDNLSRGAAAKIVCNLVLGVTTTEALAADTAPFSDVPVGSVYAGYISYCASQGIVSGYADGTFRPYADLSGYAFMKMLLGALGYDAKIEGYVGENWSISVAKRALSIGMDDGLVEDFDGTKPLPREVACLFALNTLTADMVGYKKSTTASVGGIEITSGGVEPQTQSNSKNNDFRGSANGDNVMQFCEAYFPGLKYSANTDPFMRPVRKWTNKNDEIGTFVNYSALSGMDTGDLNKKTLVNMIGADLSKRIVTAFNDATFRNDDVVFELYVDGLPKFKEANVDNVPAFKPSSLLKAGDTSVLSLQWISRGASTEAFVEEDYNYNGKLVTKVTVVVVNSNLYFTDTGYNPTAQTLRADLVSANVDNLPSIELKLEDFDNIEDFKEETWLLVTYSHKDQEVQSIEEARTVSGPVSSFRFSASVIVDGTSYYWNGRSNVDTNDPNRTFASGDKAGYTHTDWQNNFETADNVTVVLDGNGNVFWVAESDGHGNYVYVEAFASANSFNKVAVANAYFADGSNEIITVDKVIAGDGKEYSTYSAITGNKDKCLTGMWYVYTMSGDSYILSHPGVKKESDYNVDLKTITPKAGDVIVEKGTIKFFGAVVADGVICNTATEFIYLGNDGEVTTYNGGIKNIPGLVVPAGVPGNEPVYISYIYRTSGSAKIATHVFVDCSNLSDVDLTGGDTGSDVFMIMQNQRNWTYASGNKYVTVKALVNGNESNIDVALENGMGMLTTGVLYKNGVVNANGHYIRATEVGADKDEFSGSTTTPIGFDEDFVILGGKKYLTEKNITLVVGKGVSAMLHNGGANYQYMQGVSAKQLKNLLEGVDYAYNYYGILNDDNSDVVDQLYIYVAGAFKSGDTSKYEKLTIVTDAYDRLGSGNKAGVGFNNSGDATMLGFMIKVPANANWTTAEVFYKITTDDGRPIFTQYDANRDVDSAVPGENYQFINTAWNKLYSGFTMDGLQGMTGVTAEVYVVTDDGTYYGKASGLTIDRYQPNITETVTLDIVNDCYDYTGRGINADLGFSSDHSMLCFKIDVPDGVDWSNKVTFEYTISDNTGATIMGLSGSRAINPGSEGTYQFSLTGTGNLQSGYTMESVQGKTNVTVEVTVICGTTKYYGKETGLTIDTFTKNTSGEAQTIPVNITRGGFAGGADLGFNSSKTMLCFKVDKPDFPEGVTKWGGVSINYKITDSEGKLIMEYNTASRTINFSSSTYQFSLTGAGNLKNGYTMETVKGLTNVSVEITVVDGNTTYYGQASGLTIAS